MIRKTTTRKTTIQKRRFNDDELDALLARGLASKELAAAEFWQSVTERTDDDELFG